MDEHGLARLRQEYRAVGIDDSALPAEPLQLWRSWLDDAAQAGLPEVNAMVVSTVDVDGAPSSRTVLCKDADARGFVFFTNYESRKGRALAAEPRVGLLFPWHALARQVIVSGVAERLPRAQSAAYFATRPRGAQVGAWASRQSTPVASRDELERRYAEVDAEYDGRDVPCPPHWGGFLVRPATIEFWQGRENRLHDRVRYRRDRDGWTIDRLSP